MTSIAGILLSDKVSGTFSSDCSVGDVGKQIFYASGMGNCAGDGVPGDTSITAATKVVNGCSTDTVFYLRS